MDVFDFFVLCKRNSVKILRIPAVLGFRECLIPRLPTSLHLFFSLVFSPVPPLRDMSPSHILFFPNTCLFSLCLAVVVVVNCVTVLHWSIFLHVFFILNLFVLF